VKEAEQKSGDGFEHDGLPDNEENRDQPVEADALFIEVRQPVAEEVENEKKVSDHEERVDRQLDGKRNERFAGFGFHSVRSKSENPRVFVAQRESVNRKTFAPGMNLPTFQSSDYPE
jgi:hypothetical protein